jgi:biotin transport system substrate-specific component
MPIRIVADARAEGGSRDLARLLILSALGAALTAIGSRIAIPFWPVPVTLQVFFVLLCGVTLGRKWGALAQAEYVGAGAIGLPVFAGGKAGLAALLGPTGGYLVGFIAAAYVTGWLAEILAGRRGGLPAATIAGAATIWLCGWAWLAVWAAAGGESAPLRAAFAWGVVPFLAVDVGKAIAAAALGRALIRFSGGSNR